MEHAKPLMNNSLTTIFQYHITQVLSMSKSLSIPNFSIIFWSPYCISIDHNMLDRLEELEMVEFGLVVHCFKSRVFYLS